MAHKKAAGSAKNLRDSNPKYRGVKVFGGQPVVAGNIIIRQKGNKYEAGKNTYIAKDFSIHASIDGVVKFSKKNKLRFDGRKYLKTVVNVVVEAPKEQKSTAKSGVSKASTNPKSTTKKTTSSKGVAKKPATKKPVAKKATSKTAVAKKTVAKKTTTTKKVSK